MRLKILIPIIVLVISGLACVGEIEKPLIVGAAPVSFTLLGEVDHLWIINVSKGKQYQVTLKRNNSKHSLDELYLWFYIRYKDSYKKYEQVDKKIFDNEATINFTAPMDGQMTVYIASEIGERQESLGTFTLEIQEVN